MKIWKVHSCIDGSLGLADFPKIYQKELNLISQLSLVLWVWGKEKAFTNISSLLANFRNWYNKCEVLSDTLEVGEISFISHLKHRWPLPALSGFQVSSQDITLYLRDISVPNLQLLIAQHIETLLGSSF